MKLFVAGLSYRTAPVELREQLAVPPARLHCVGCRLKIGGALSETVVLSTCNRVEIYGVSEKVNVNIQRLFALLRTAAFETQDRATEEWANREFEVAPCLYVHEGEEAVRHLLSVASGLDSMVLGETEITGQVKQAYQSAREAKLTGRVLNRVFQKALQTAKIVRSRTNIDSGSTSAGSMALAFAEKIFGGDLSQKSLMIIGAGKMGEACIRHLAKRGVKRVLVSNRSFERAQTLAANFGGSAIRLDECIEAMADVDIAVSSTGAPQTILHRADIEKVMRERGSRPLALIDIAVPRDIDPEVQFIPSVYLYDIDDLETIVRENVKNRQQELARCDSIIDEETNAVMAKIAWTEARSHETKTDYQTDWIPCGVPA